MLRAAFWNAMVLVRAPVQLGLKVVMLIHLIGALGGVVVLFTGTGLPALDSAPLIFRLLASLYMLGVYILASWASLRLDRAVEQGAPGKRRIFLPL
ncbi:hypothetical protein LV780_21575 (plasmid) [Cereibacter azotoformans]|uniref:hypothetical protein n=1 Tax=Cereibacter azotoformans TaxID=43057 RepID=UPI000E35D44B|nr:hypothetical protein [Cereibacter azotoformans]AXQ96324.1 hypothetical protein D0Z66_21775 [Cereibacter sphaeroides]UIJ33241.1 hypothetical protein LV780_21575 [Cereibacter azotoformans]